MAYLSSLMEQAHRELNNMRFCVKEIQKKLGGLQTANFKAVDEKGLMNAIDSDLKEFFDSKKYLINALLYFLPSEFEPSEHWEDWKDLDELDWSGVKTWQKPIS